jgi:ATP-dependent Clp protease ATP-binding subunit ClpC
VTEVFERFTDRSRRVIVLAQEHARRRGDAVIEPWHVLMGLVHENEGVAAVVLRELGITPETVDASSEITGSPSSGHLPFTAGTKRSLEDALRCALELGHNYVGTEHLLLGLVRHGDGAVVHYLANRDIHPIAVRTAVLAKLRGYDAPERKRKVALNGIYAQAFVAWAAHFAEVNGPLADDHPLVVVRRAIEAS